MAKKIASLADDVAARAKNTKPGRSPWQERLTPSQMQELEDTRTKWASGALGGLQIRACARAIVESCVERGWPMPKAVRVEEWLREAVR